MVSVTKWDESRAGVFNKLKLMLTLMRHFVRSFKSSLVGEQKCSLCIQSQEKAKVTQPKTSVTQLNDNLKEKNCPLIQDDIMDDKGNYHQRHTRIGSRIWYSVKYFNNYTTIYTKYVTSYLVQQREIQSSSLNLQN